MTQQLYTIVVKPRPKKDGTFYYHVMLVNQKEDEKGDIQFRCILEIQGTELKTLSGTELKQPNEVWTESNWINVAKSLFMFFTKSKHTASKSWTDFWYVTNKKKLEYKMYDCSLKFIKANVLNEL